MDKPDLYDSQPKSAYMLWKPFDMPTPNGTAWAIALPSDHAKFLNASLSVVYTVIFSWLWGLIAAAVIYSVPRRFTRRRLVALVALRNASSPWSALQAFAAFTSESMGCFRPKRHGQPSTLIDSLFGLVFAAICLVVVTASITMGIIGPPFLQIGNVAPVTPSVLFYPQSQNIRSPAAYRAFFGDASIRALSSVAVFPDEIWSPIVQVQGDPAIAAHGTDKDKEPMYGLTYSYNITGVELGLIHSLDLTLRVRGGCRTEYRWLNKSRSGKNLDHYDLFGDTTNTFGVNLTPPYLTSMPKTSFTLKSQAANRAEVLEGNVSYAVVTTMAHRRSEQSGNDPWYLTELRPEEEMKDLAETKYPFRVKSGRPALSCWHQDTWSCCGGESLIGVFQFQNKTRLGIPTVVKDVMTSALVFPPMQRIGENSGMSALTSLISSLMAKDGIINADSANIYQDMKRLIIASYITTLNTLAYSTRFKPSNEEMTKSNQFYDNDKGNALKPGADDFVVTTPNVQTFSLSGLITAASIAVFLLVLKLILTIKLWSHGNPYAGLPDSEEMDPHQMMTASPVNTDRWARYKAFSAVNLLRNIYEDGTGASQKDWKCSEGLPEPRDRKPLELVRCSHGDYGCAGHLATAPELLELGLEGRKRRHTKVNSLSTLLGDGDISFQHADDTSKNTQVNVTVAPFNGDSSSRSTTQQDEMWSPDIQTGYNSYFPQTQSGPYQNNTGNYHDDIPIRAVPPLQQPANYYSGSIR